MEKEKEALLTEMKQLKENHDIIKNELNERLQEICHLRVGSTLCSYQCMLQLNLNLSLKVSYLLEDQ